MKQIIKSHVSVSRLSVVAPMVKMFFQFCTVVRGLKSKIEFVRGENLITPPLLCQLWNEHGLTCSLFHRSIVGSNGVGILINAKLNVLLEHRKQNIVACWKVKTAGTQSLQNLFCCTQANVSCPMHGRCVRDNDRLSKLCCS